MSDEAGDSNRAAPEGFESWNAYWTAQGMPWRTEPEIGHEQQQFLLSRTQIKVNLEQGVFPFRGVPLGRADIEWLIAHLGAVKPLDLRGANLQKVNLSKLPMKNLQGCIDFLLLSSLTAEQLANGAINLEGTDLRGAELTGAKLRDARLQSAFLVGACLDGADLSVAHLVGADLRNASLRKVNLGGTFQATGQSGASQELYVAHMENADLSGAHLDEANLRRARLEGASLQGAHLEGTDLSNAHLQGADLRRAVFSGDSKLDGIKLADKKYGPARLGDIQWGGVDLTVIDWHTLRRLGDEKPRREYATSYKPPPDRVEKRTRRSGPVGDNSSSGSDVLTLLVTSLLVIFGLWVAAAAVTQWWSPTQHLEAARANRRLAMALREQGIIEADHFAYRAQVCQRGVLLRRLHIVRWLFSGLIDVLAGYGYKPLRTLFWYGAAVSSFAFCYYYLGSRIGVPLTPVGAFVFSLTSFHGRGFFPGGSSGHNITLDDPLTVFAACEAAVGLLIEASFIATFTQRFFAR